jgi:phage terminase large subunit
VTFTPKQLEAARLLSSPNATRILLYGGARAGKSHVIAYKLLQRAIDYPGVRQIVFRKTMADARNTIWTETILPVLESVKSAVTIYKHPPHAVFENGSVIRIGGLHPSEIDRALGVEYGTIYVNEGSEVSWQNMPVLITRLNARTISTTGKQIVPKLIVDCNPPTTKHWIYVTFMLKRNPATGAELADAEAWQSLRMNPVDNANNLAPDFLASLESMSERDKARFLHGEFGQLYGLVYDCFDPEAHIYDVGASGDRYFRSIDFGFTNPFVCLWGRLASDDTLYIYRERYLPNITVDKHAEAIKQMSQGERYEATFADHDAGERAILHAHGIETRAAIKDVKTGINTVYSMIERGKIKVHRSCTGLISELQSYQWKDGQKGDEPRKENDHACDALRYMVMGIFARATVSSFEVSWL